MDMKLELVPIPVADVDRAKAFYLDRLGFVEDVDVRPADGVRFVQLTPPGSACSLGMGTGLPAFDGVEYAAISDPDGNTLTLQETSWRTGDAF